MDSRFAAALAGVVVLAVVIGVIAGKSQSGITASPAPTAIPTALPPVAPDQVEIAPVHGGAEYRPAVLTVKVGTTVNWINYDTTTHAVGSDGGQFSSSPLSFGQSYHWTPRSPGRVSYGDFEDPNLHGVIVVQP